MTIPRRESGFDVGKRALSVPRLHCSSATKCEVSSHTALTGAPLAARMPHIYRAWVMCSIAAHKAPRPNASDGLTAVSTARGPSTARKPPKICWQGAWGSLGANGVGRGLLLSLPLSRYYQRLRARRS